METLCSLLLILELWLYGPRRRSLLQGAVAERGLLKTSPHLGIAGLSMSHVFFTFKTMGLTLGSPLPLDPMESPPAIIHLPPCPSLDFVF